MQTLHSRFNHLDQEYKALLEKLNSTKTLSAYCDQDIFRIEPFYAEKNNLDADQFVLVSDPDELHGSQIFQLLISEGKILFHREWMGENCYYDGFFIYGENQKSRLHFYIKDDLIKPISLEILHFDQQGRYQRFYSIDTHAIYESSYRYNQNKIQIDYLFYDDALQVQHTAEYQIKRLPNNGEVLTIDLVEPDNLQRIYDASYKAFTLTQLLTKAQKALTDDIILACSTKKLSRKKIHCLLLEYTSQGPFPPTLAFIQEKEVKATIKNQEHPLAFLNAPDAELFFSEMEMKHYPLYQQINRHLEQMQDKEYAQEENDRDDETTEETTSESQTIIIDFYTRLSKSLKLKARQQSQLQLLPEFYVCARDFEICNEAEYLKAILPQKQFLNIQKTIDEFETQKAKDLANNPAKIEYTRVFKEAEEHIERLISEAEKLPKDYWYSDEFLFFIEPFGFEMKTEKAKAPLQDLLSKTIPSTSFYFRYQMQGQLPLSITQISEDKIVRQWYWHRTPNKILQIEWYCLKKPHIESCEVAILEAGQTLSHTAYCLILDRHDYILDDQNRIIKSICTRQFRDHPSADQMPIEIYYEYEGVDPNKNLSKSREI